MRHRRFLICVTAGILGALALSVGALAEEGGRPFSTVLTGAAEVPGPGDPDGGGTADLTLNPGLQQVCWEISVSNITLPTTGAHIHRGTASDFGPIVVHLTPPDATGASSGCTTADRALILDIMQNPEQYYVNVHTLPQYAAGAVRGQLGN